MKRTNVFLYFILLEDIFIFLLYVLFFFFLNEHRALFCIFFFVIRKILRPPRALGTVIVLRVATVALGLLVLNANRA